MNQTQPLRLAGHRDELGDIDKELAVFAPGRWDQIQGEIYFFVIPRRRDVNNGHILTYN